MPTPFDDPLLDLQYHEGELQIWYNFMYIGAIADSENLSVVAKEARVAEMIYQAKKDIEQQGD